MAMTAAANTIVPSTSTRCRRRSLASIAGYVKAFTALAITNPMTVSDISDCTAIISFAQGDMYVAPSSERDARAAQIVAELYDNVVESPG